MSSDPQHLTAEQLVDALDDLLAHVDDVERRLATSLATVDPTILPSARNLAHYLAVRQHDLRELQESLSRLGLSSLGRMEAHVVATLAAVRARLGELTRRPPVALAPPVDFAGGPAVLAEHTAQLLGDPAPDRAVRIMVTMPSEAADDEGLVRRLVAAGMDVVRINCAHDEPDAWRRMADHVGAARRATGRPCRIVADLAGPKLRTRALHAPGDRRDDAVRLHVGDTLRVARRPTSDPTLPVVGCSLPAVFDAVRAGDPIWFDDGKLGGRVVAVERDAFDVEIERAAAKGAKLRDDKGINLPETDLDVPSLTPDDLAALDAVAPHVDAVGLSFVRRPDDVERLHDELERRDASRLGVLLKIENRPAFDALPSLLLAGLRSPPLGVMVARGDLAVELGYERLAEVQEQILWMCEAAHVPVVWATQVLEDLAKTGTPTRAEITDAAMSGRAEAVMLNKGEHVVEAVACLARILGRMDSHQRKKTAMLGPLEIARRMTR